MLNTIIPAGGAGLHLHPLTKVSRKRLEAARDKPIFHYSLTFLIAAGVREFCIIPALDDLLHIKEAT